MQRLVDVVKKTIATGLWQPALVFALTLPDICTGLERDYDKRDHTKSYIEWLDTFMRSKYSVNLPHQTEEEQSLWLEINRLDRFSEEQMHAIEKLRAIPMIKKETQFLTGADFWSLRCALIHDGTPQTIQSKDRIINKFQITTPREDYEAHNNYTKSGDRKDYLQIQVDIFCDEICEAVMLWHQKVDQTPEVMKRKSERLLIL